MELKKRMLEIKTNPADSKPTVYINSSSLEIIQSCPRKALYLLERKLVREGDEHEAQTFGSAIHAALETFYKSSPGDRSLDSVLTAFDLAGTRLKSLDASSKRSLENGRKIIAHYFKTYELDPWVIYQDKDGPFCERSFELPCFETEQYRVVAFGKIDAILTQIDTGEMAVCDHKTTSSLGDAFFKSIKPRHQFSLYTWAARKLGIQTNSFMMNGIAVLKTRQECARIFADYTEEDFLETKAALRSSIDSYLTFKQTDAWPMNTAQCHTYGGCQYLEVCSSPAVLIENVIQSNYGSVYGQAI